MLNKKFVFAVSLVAMMAVSNAWATDPASTPSTSDTVGTAHSVFTAYTPTEAGSKAGIAGVTYVNRAVNSAGNAAIAAENHAAASGAYAIDAKSAAQQANTAAAAAKAAADAAQATASEGVTKANAAQQTANENASEIAKKFNVAQGSSAVNKAVITDASGNVTTGTIATGMITDGAVTGAKIGSGAVTSAKIADKTIVNADVADGAAIAQSKIAGLTDALNLKGTKVTTTDETSGKSAAELNALYPSVSYLNTVTQKLTDGVNEQINDLSQDVEDLKGTTAELGNLAFEDTVTSALITDGAVATADIAGSAVTTAKIADSNVTTAKIADKAVTSAKIADKTIVNADVADNAAIAASKIAGLATVATSGSYSDLSDKPAINNATLTIKKNGTSVGTFTANASANNEIDITVPTTVASLTDAGSYATVAAMNAADAKKVNVAQETENAIMTTDASGNVAPVAIVDAGSGTYVTDVVVDAGKVTLSRANGPTVNNATLTIKKNGTSVGTFTANASANKEIDIAVPTTVASLTDAGSYATVAAMNTADAKKVSIAQGSTAVNKAVITDAGGNVTTGTIATGMITDGAVTSAKIADKTIVNADVADNAAIAASKIAGLATVATSGSYSDLSGKPAINNATLTIKKNGTSVGTFTANASANNEINITVPTTVASLTDAGSYATVAAMNTADAKKVSIAQGSTAVNKAVITDASGNVTTGTIATGMITDGAVTSAKIADKTIVNADVADNAAIAQSKIAGLTDALNLKGTKVTTTDETSGKSAAELNALYPSVSYLNTVTQKLTDGVNEQINDLSQDVEDLKGTTAELGNLAFEDTVTSALITDGAVATVDIAGAAVTTAKIADSNVTTAKIASSAVTSAKIADSNVTTAKIADKAVTAGKTSGVIGKIPSGSATASTYADIWVE